MFGDRRTSLVGLDGIHPLGEVPLPLLLLLGDSAGVLLGHGAAQGAGLLRAEVEGQVLLFLVEETELVALGGVDDGQDAGDGLANVVAETPVLLAKPIFFDFLQCTG